MQPVSLEYMPDEDVFVVLLTSPSLQQWLSLFERADSRLVSLSSNTAYSNPETAGHYDERDLQNTHTHAN